MLEPNTKAKHITNKVSAKKEGCNYHNHFISTQGQGLPLIKVKELEKKIVKEQMTLPVNLTQFADPSRWRIKILHPTTGTTLI